MHRLALLLGVFLAVAIVGCGGGGGSSSDQSTAGGGASSGKSFKASSPTATLTEPEMRSFIEREVDAEMSSQGLSEEEIACVNANIAKMSGEEMAGGVVKPGDAEGDPGSMSAYLAGLGKGCI